MKWRILFEANGRMLPIIDILLKTPYPEKPGKNKAILEPVPECKK